MSDVEDQSLDSFFAKKDKSKKPKKKKKTKSNETTETQSESATKSQRQVDEWNDFQEEKEKDYSSLKMQDLQICDDGLREEVEEEVDGGGDEVDREKPSNENQIWKKQSNSTTTAPAKPAPVELPGTENVVGGKYVPPSMKRAAMAGPVSRRRIGQPPDIGSQAAFPTLGAASQDNTVPRDFEMVKRGTRSTEARVDDNRPRLNLDNRFDGLRS